MSKFIQLLNNPIINRINPKLEQLELLEQLKFNKFVKKQIENNKKQHKVFSIFHADKFSNLWVKD